MKVGKEGEKFEFKKMASERKVDLFFIVAVRNCRREIKNWNI